MLILRKTIKKQILNHKNKLFIEKKKTLFTNYIINWKKYRVSLNYTDFSVWSKTKRLLLYLFKKDLKHHSNKITSLKKLLKVIFFIVLAVYIIVII